MKSYRNARIVMLLALGVICLNACQKMEQPPLGDYPKDANPPGGPLKFFAAMDEKNVDSIKANYGTFNNASIVAGGVSGMCAQFDGSQNGYINYPSANDFASTASDFTISFWINATLAQKDHVNADGVMALANTLNVDGGPNGFWGNFTIYADHETSTSDSMLLKIALFRVDSLTSFDGANWKWPKMYDGQWHHVVYTYTAADSLLTAYRDGAFFNKVTTGRQIKFGFASQLILGGFQEAVGIVSDYPSNTWMSGFPGEMDNVRLYSEALSADDIKSIYDNKQ